MALLDAFRSQVESHARFFDHLVELVPAKHYIEREEPPANLKYLRKDARANEKRRLREVGKQRKRARLDPDAAQPTALDLQRQQAAAPAAEHGSAPAVAARLPLGGAAPSVEELRQRLHKRIVAMRQGRHADDIGGAGAAAAAGGKASQVQAAREWRRQAASKRKRPEADAPPVLAAAQAPAAPVAAGLRFSRVDLGPDATKKRRRKKAGKAELLEAAQQKQEQRQALEGTVEGRVLAEEEGWKSAMARASGQRVLDDPKRLSRSLKKEAKLKAKKAQAWGERQAHQRKEQAAKQAKRTDNLASRAQAKLARRKDKREKKLMRAGFEGRRDTFINA
ncbi:hypothetical protein WJX81_002643 [Elliptochloris bilobata]|uniref:Ribosomal RNA-processing protein 14/surfeit locus protein 6 C-terminal domain-containing protein n=1 Tax=Elliptochloris bilobata TaxID=381761 RepID=A0AAW1SLB4_9CHLO